MPAITDKSFTNSIGMEFMLIPAGLFMMGSPETEKGRYSDETPHKVTITQPFYLGKYPVIQAQWQAVMGENPSYFNGDDKPVEAVSWNDVQRFIERLNQKEKTWRYRLPTEAEWEYAARAGSKTAWCFGDNENQLRDYAWYGEYCWETGSTHPVGQKKPNAWGLHDMHGNVWEWVQDWYAGWYYGASLPVDPQGPDSGADRVFRGGGWGGSALSCRSALRFHDSPVIRSHLLGFRVAFS
ncbi:formylglycine-generating enzyme family protein [Desulfosarcina sp. OttesenSCG-928-G10]|nr:formylglycine-generating enzyme family protein [Desulfosarcina sp. OttesenSCG-928-G10]